MTSLIDRQIVRASLKDAAIAVDILTEVSVWLERRGRPLWDSKAVSLAEFEQAASAGELVLGYQKNQAVACMLLQ